MEFNAIHATNLTREIREYFADESAHLGTIDMTYAGGDMPCIYVEFFANGNRYLADVSTKDDGAIDWIY